MGQTVSMLRVAAAAAVAAVALASSSCAGNSRHSDGCFRFSTASTVGKVVAAGDRQPTCGFTGSLLNGGTFTLSQDSGKVVVVNFWAQWCGPCKVETPQFDLMYRANKANGVDFVGIDTKDTRDQAEPFVKNYNITYPIVFDEPGRTAVALGKIPSNGLPFTVLVDKHQRIAAVYLSTLTAKDLQPVLDLLAAEA
jgi:thiol-disulfide isomerase/thioredoxin